MPPRSWVWHLLQTVLWRLVSVEVPNFAFVLSIRLKLWIAHLYTIIWFHTWPFLLFCLSESRTTSIFGSVAPATVTTLGVIACTFVSTLSWRVPTYAHYTFWPSTALECSMTVTLTVIALSYFGIIFFYLISLISKAYIFWKRWWEFNAHHPSFVPISFYYPFCIHNIGIA